MHAISKDCWSVRSIDLQCLAIYMICYEHSKHQGAGNLSTSSMCGALQVLEADTRSHSHCSHDRIENNSGSQVEALRRLLQEEKASKQQMSGVGNFDRLDESLRNAVSKQVSTALKEITNRDDTAKACSSTKTRCLCSAIGLDAVNRQRKP